MGINGGRGISSGLTLGGSGISLAGGGTPPFSFGNALQFDGVNDYTSFSNITLATNASFSFWFKISNARTMWAFSGDVQMDICRIITSTSVRIGKSNASYADFTVPTCTDDSWHHILIRKSGNNFRLYFDGVESSSGVQSITSSITINRLSNTYLFFSGAIDEAAYWNVDIGDVASDLYNSGNGAFATNFSEANLQNYWRYNGVSGDSTATDEINSNTQTLNNFDTATCWVAH